MKFSGVTILQGVEFSIFPIDFEWALQQCSATALPVIEDCYMNGHGMSMALLYIINEVYTATTDKQVNVLVSLDLRLQHTASTLAD